MSEPGHHLPDSGNRPPFGHFGSRNHDDRKTELARRINFGSRTVSPGISRDNPFDRFGTHQGEVAVHSEGPACDDDVGLGQRQRAAGFIDEAQDVGVLGLGGKGLQMLSPDREKHACRLVWQRPGRSAEIRDIEPAVRFANVPWRSHEGYQWRCCAGTSGNRVAADGTGEWMGGVDNMRDAFVTQVACEPFRASITSRAHWQWLAHRNLGTACIRVDRFNSDAGQSICERVRVTRSAQNEDTGHE